MALTAGGDGARMERAQDPRWRGVRGRGRAAPGRPGCRSGVAAAAAAGGQCQEEPGAPGAKAAGMSPLPSRRAGDGALSLCSYNPMLGAKRESSWAFPSSPPSGEPSMMQGTVEMSWPVWGAGAVGQDGERAGFLSIGLGGEVATSCLMLPVGVDALVD